MSINSESKKLYEIEIKALLTEEQYNRLSKELSQKMKIINSEVLHTHKFVHNQNDIRLRHSDKKFELVNKNGESTDISRQETTIPLSSKNEIDNIIKLFKTLNFEQHPSWITHKQEYEYNFKGFTYNISIQKIIDFYNILEVEFQSNSDDSSIHKQNMIEIIKSFGLEPIDSKDFKEKIKDYIRTKNN